MKSQIVLLTALAGLICLAACQKAVAPTERELPADASITVNPGTLEFRSVEDTLQVTFVATRIWEATYPDWVKLSVVKGAGGADEKTMLVSVSANPYSDRTGEIVLEGKGAMATILVKQAGDGLPEPPDTPEPGAKGTVENPYTPAEANEVGRALNVDETIETEVYITGIISSIESAFDSRRGLATFNISEDGSTEGEQFYVCRVLYLDNQKWTEGNDNINVGDKVVVYGIIENSGRNQKPQTKAESAYIYSIQGPEKGTLAHPYTPAEANAVGSALGVDEATEADVYIAGIISSIESAFESRRGLATFNISIDGKTDSEQFYVCRVLFLNNEKWTDGNDNVNVGDEVVVVGKIENSGRNQKPQTKAEGAWLHSLKHNQNPDSGTDPGTDPGTGNGTGTLEDPFNATGALALAQSLAPDAVTKDVYYIKGKVSSLIDGGFSSRRGIGSFTISADGTTEGEQFRIWRSKYIGGRDWTDSDPQIAVGDEVIVCAKLENGRGGTQPQTNQDATYLYSLNGKTE